MLSDSPDSVEVLLSSLLPQPATISAIAATATSTPINRLSKGSPMQ